VEFEDIDDMHQRAKVINGWIVKTFQDVYHYREHLGDVTCGHDFRVAMVFVPDPNHEWEI